ncbi:uncharacterized protein L969DRAFT_89264 [Mixia osmundae IAM 14324]|uniref:(2E,6E)-farnesyl diphosphate synthase n=1 Tax=Mixia osmundae (strain CBS 9802 / IAM 14324 / JCM 22182 / KY 12970) TaxID=764103 RepID=G7DSC7_MIXOS|nr:uncharacterized protein L969DRAFT_89264 [Mixia osmundae IAM 14324]KEI38017.1 hypothetical protein L969DRAFT_89264 [Mixia osmundae IAM 14324]GAA93487.1 hypothetical protein E5Q_00128 [Mixia osmundae IAM 14324]
MSSQRDSFDDFIARHRQSRPWPSEREQILLEPFHYIDSSGGKEIRSQLIDAFNVWMQVSPDALEIVKRIVKMLHVASLLMDDVEDDSVLRRGIPVAHKVFGVPQTINSANYVYFLALQDLASLRSHRGVNIQSLVNEELLNLHRGQGMDLYWRDTLTCPTEQDYIEMVNFKTGGLFRIATKLMQACSTRPDSNVEAYEPLVNLIGVLFQIRDDYMNLQSSQYADHKGYCEDLTEGKFSFPIVHSIRADSSNSRLINVLRQHSSDPSLKAWAVAYMQETGSFAYCRDVLSRLDVQAREEIERLGGNPLLLKIIDKMRIPDTTDDGTLPLPGEVANPVLSLTNARH